MSTALAERIADLAEELARRETEATIRILEAQGKTVTFDGGTILVKFPGVHFTCGLVPGAGPIDQIPPLLFALIGPWWMTALTDVHGQAQKIVTNRFKERKKQARAAKG